MPITCEQNTANRANRPEVSVHTQNTQSTESSAKFPNFILHLFAAKCTDFLKMLTHSSLLNIQHDYFNGQTTIEIEELKKMVDTAPHFTLLALFFLLLNIDSKLKDRVWDLELESNYAKLERFLLDLKHPIVSEFCIDDTISTAMLIDQIWETYVIA